MISFSRAINLRFHALTGVALALAGCNSPPAVNPFVDSSIPRSAWSTPSAETYLATGAQPVIRRKDTPPVEAPLAIHQVPHYPLWWEDPFEDQGDNNDTFAWTWQDYFAGPYSYGRMILNTLAFPVSAVVTPPGTPMVSNGWIEDPAYTPRPSFPHPHDAMVGHSPDPVAGPADFGFSDPDPIEQTPPPEAAPIDVLPPPVNPPAQP